MKSILITAGLLLMTVFTINVNGQISEKDKADITKVYEAAGNAFKNMDATAMSKVFTVNAVHIDPMGKIVRGQANILSYFTDLFSFFKSQPKADKSTTNQSDWTGRYIAPGIILTDYTEETVNSIADKKSSIKYSFSILLTKKNGKWLAEQVTMTPVVKMD